MKENFLEKHSLSAGDLVEAKKGAELFTGYVVPSEEEGVLVLKLKTGYNIGINSNEIISVKKLGEEKIMGKPKTIELKKNASLPTISILHTGGTIASRVDYRTGAVFSSFEPKDLLSMFPELGQTANFDSRLVAKMWSDDLRFPHFEKIAKAIEEEAAKGVEGIIIGMGTDNLAVASAAMSFVLEKCPLPVIFVGAQRSSDRGSSDAAMNLLSAAQFITKTDFAGVAICMHEGTADEWCAILPATKARKMHSSRRDAFKPVNDSAIARVNFKTKEIQFLKKNHAKKEKGAKFSLKPKFEEKTGVLKIHINMHSEEFEFFEKNGFKGLVLEGTGLGHTPGHVPDELSKPNEKIFPALKKVIDSGCVVVMATQCLYGRVQMHVYDKGTDLVKLGVVPGEDMLPETAFVKLAWLLGNYPKEKVKELIALNLRGEISERTPLDSVAGE
ncbi:MAG: Glu-tRNA(Gln) amidotransferase subunit GatD [Candidatus Diapherotrites archaeon]